MDNTMHVVHPRAAGLVGSFPSYKWPTPLQGRKECSGKIVKSYATHICTGWFVLMNIGHVVFSPSVTAFRY